MRSPFSHLCDASLAFPPAAISAHMCFVVSVPLSSSESGSDRSTVKAKAPWTSSWDPTLSFHLAVDTSLRSTMC